MDYIALSKEVSFALRHAPQEYGLELDEEGFVPVEELLAALNERPGRERLLTVNDLQEIVHSSDKKRHEIVDGKIRAYYGHTTSQKIVKREAAPPPAVLYHGTAHRFLDTILKEGLKPMARQYVHLSADIETAKSVGARRDPEPVVLAIDAESAWKDGIRFYIGNGRVWLADKIPAKYLSVLEPSA